MHQDNQTLSLQGSWSEVLGMLQGPAEWLRNTDSMANTAGAKPIYRENTDFSGLTPPKITDAHMHRKEHKSAENESQGEQASAKCS